MPTRPNIVFVVPDQFRQQALGCMHADPVITPNFDRFADEALVLTHAVSNYPVCSPYRAMLFTGKYPYANGVVGNCNSQTVPYRVYLQPDACCLSDVLCEAGYECGYIGKYHLDPPSDDDVFHGEGMRGDGRVWDAYTPPGPRRHGFGFWHSYGCCDKHMTPHYWVNDAPVSQPLEVRKWSVEHETDVAVSYIHNAGGERNPDKPFALFVAHNPPHTPFQQVPQGFVDMYGDAEPADLLNRPNLRLEGPGEQAGVHAKNYFAAVTGIDHHFGRILDALDETGGAQDTIVIFTADHGEMMGSQGRMHKDVWYDESFLIPFLIRWPDHIKPGRDDLLLSVPDVMPTLLALAGVGDKTPGDIDGRDFSQTLCGQDCERPDSAFYLTPRFDNPQGGRRGVRTHRWVFAIDRQEHDPEKLFLYDCVSDPFQLENVADQRPDVVAEMQVLLGEWLERTDDPWAV